MKRNGTTAIKESRSGKPGNDQSSSSSTFGFGGKLFAGQRGFDPKTIILQIISLQLTYYTTLSFCTLLMNIVTGHRSHLGQFFSPSVFDYSLDYSYVTLFSNLLNILFVILAEAYIVEKANKCLDFTLTVFILHLGLVWYVYRFPNTMQWWLTHGLLVTITVLASEYFCLKLETAEIKLSVGHILEKGKEIGKEAAQKIISTRDQHKSSNKKQGKDNRKGQVNNFSNDKELQKQKLRDKTVEV